MMNVRFGMVRFPSIPISPYKDDVLFGPHNKLALPGEETPGTVHVTSLAKKLREIAQSFKVEALFRQSITRTKEMKYCPDGSAWAFDESDKPKQVKPGLEVDLKGDTPDAEKGAETALKEFLASKGITGMSALTQEEIDNLYGGACPTI